MTPFGKQLHEQLQSLYAPKPQLYAGSYGPGQGGPENTIQGPDERPVSPAPQASQPSSIVAATQAIAPAPAPAPKKAGKVNETGFKPPPAPVAVAPPPVPAPAPAPVVAPVAPAPAPTPAPAPVPAAFNPATFRFDPSTMLDWASISQAANSFLR